MNLDMAKKIMFETKLMIVRTARECGSKRSNCEYFFKNTADYIWETATNSWVANLFTDETIKKLSKFKCGKTLYNFYQRLRFYLTRKPIISVCEYVVTTKCTMNCKHCNTFMPYFTKDTHLKMVTFETFKNDIDRLLKSVDYIYCFGFVGGGATFSKGFG